MVDTLVDATDRLSAVGISVRLCETRPSWTLSPLLPSIELVRELPHSAIGKVRKGELSS